MPSSILIFTPQISNRLRYVTELIYKDLLGFEELDLSSSEEDYAKAKGVKLAYTSSSKGLTIPIYENFIFGTTIEAINLEINWKDNLPYAFKVEEYIGNMLLDFDFHAWIFYLVSRYEEYLPFKPEKHGRFAASQSLAFREGFLDLPVVNLWVEKLRAVLIKHFPHHNIPEKPIFRYQPSYDIDYAWMYKHKGVKRQVGGLGRDLLKGAFAKVRQRLEVLYFQQEDPYFTFAYLDHLHSQYSDLQPIYFWLLGDHGPYDKNTNPKLKVMQDLIKEHQQYYLIGIHPSYASNAKEGQLEKELNRLELITKQKVLLSRQHFLRLNFPSTYRSLLKAGIRADYSMGYADQIGFRASVASSFYWYDLEKEEITDLKIHPFMFMDVTLKNYMRVQKDEVLNIIQPIVDLTKAVGGELMTIWHNNSFCECEGWEGWRKVYEEALEYIF